MKNEKTIVGRTVRLAIGAGLLCATGILYSQTLIVKALFAGVLVITGLQAVLVSVETIRILETISNVLHKVLSRKADIALPRYEDNHLSKIVNQASEIVEMAESDHMRAQREKERVKELVSDISHQLKTPLANLQMYHALLTEQEAISAADREAFLSQIGEQVNRIQWLTEGLVKVSRLESGLIDIRGARASVKDTLVASLQAAYADALDKQIELELEPFEDLHVRHDRRWTAEALGNVLDNAVKYSPSGSTVRLCVRQEGLYVRVDVTDQGRGIGSNEQHKVFQRFYRGENTADQSGVGIGLYLSRMIFEMQSGYMRIASEVNKGTTVSVFLLNCKN